jgi:chromosome transmission fidelity protein 4
MATAAPAANAAAALPVAPEPQGEGEGVVLDRGHGPGACDLAPYSSAAGSFFVTGGEDGNVELHEAKVGEKRVERVASREEDSEICALAVHGQEVAVGFRDCFIRTFSLPEFGAGDDVTRLQAQPRALSYSASGELLACAGEEPGVRIVSRVQKATYLTLGSDECGAKDLSWCPSGSGLLLASSGLDGGLRIYSVSADLDEINCERIFRRQACMLSNQETPGRISWHPSEICLALPGLDSICVLRPAEDLDLEKPWQADYLMRSSGPAATPNYTAVSFSPDGKFLASASASRSIVVWDWAEKLELRIFHLLHDSAVGCAFAWLSAPSLAVQATSGGHAVLWSAAADAALAQPREQDPEEVVSTAGGLLADEAEEVREGDESDMDTVAGEPAPSLVGSMRVPSLLGHGSEAGGIDDDSVAGFERPAARRPWSLPVPVARMQEPFQPSSTPIDDERRYLCWNSLGSICVITEDRSNTVEVTFTDRNRGRRERFSDRYGFVLGALGQGGGVFASLDTSMEGDDGAGEDSSVVHYLPLSHSAAGESWTKRLPRGDGVLCVAAGDAWVAAATASQRLRIFSAGGLQNAILSLPGPVVSMAGSGPLLGVVFHAGSPVRETQNLAYMLLDVGAGRELGRGPVCLSQGSELTWMGFTSELMLCLMDSRGLISGLSPTFGGAWTPLLETGRIETRNKSDGYWPVGVEEGQFIAVILKGGDKHPSTFPQPVTTALPLEAPIALSEDPEHRAQDAADAAYLPQAALLRQRVKAEAAGISGMGEQLVEKQVQMDKTLLRAMAEQLTRQSVARASDLADRLSLPKSLGLAVTLADRYGFSDLAGRIEQRAELLAQGGLGETLPWDQVAAAGVVRLSHGGEGGSALAGRGGIDESPLAAAMKMQKERQRQKRVLVAADEGQGGGGNVEGEDQDGEDQESSAYLDGGAEQLQAPHSTAPSRNPFALADGGESPRAAKPSQSQTLDLLRGLSKQDGSSKEQERRPRKILRRSKE